MFQVRFAAAALFISSIYNRVFNYRFAAFHRLKNRFAPPSAKTIAAQALSLILIISLLTVSTPAAPTTGLLAAIGELGQDIRYSYLSQIESPNSLLAGIADNLSISAFLVNPALGLLTGKIFKRKGRQQENRAAAVTRIEIAPGQAVIREGEQIALTAVGYDEKGVPVQGVGYNWTATPLPLTDASAAQLKAQPGASTTGGAAEVLPTGVFDPDFPGIYTITAQAAGTNITNSIRVMVVPDAPLKALKEKTMSAGGEAKAGALPLKKATGKPKALRSAVTNLMAQPLPAPVNNSTRMTKETVKDLDKWDEEQKQRKAAPAEPLSVPAPGVTALPVVPSRGGPSATDEADAQSEAPMMSFSGQITGINANTHVVSGWAYDPGSSYPYYVYIYVDGTYLTSVYTNEAGCPPAGSGNCSFNYTIPDQYIDNRQHTLTASIFDYSTWSNVPLTGSPQNFTFAVTPSPKWNNGNFYTEDDPGLQPGTPANTGTSGAGSENFSFSSPIVSLGGRGLNVNLSLNYNSLLWHQANGEIIYDIDKGNPGPGWSLLGIGKMMDMDSAGGSMIEDQDGTRHSYDGSIQAGYYAGSSTYYGHTTDGSFIDYISSRSAGGISSGTAYLPNGTVITYGAPAADGGAVYPTQIKDRSGNYITIAYLNNQGPNISTITDTEGRIIQFQYDPNNYLLSISGPAINPTGIGQNPNATQTYVRIHHRHQPITTNFSGLNTLVRNSNPYVIDAIYYPGTNTGYWFGDADSYSTYGMLAKVVEQRGMSWMAGATGQDQGTFTPGVMTRQMTYNYPLTAGGGLTSAPQYTQMTEDWAGRDAPAPAVTTYNVNNNATPRTTSITLPNGNTIRQSSYNHPGVWDDGLLYQVETISPASQTLAKSNTVWELGHYSAPRVTEADATDELNQTTRQTFAYDTVYNQVTVANLFGYSNNLLRKTVRTYENGSNYVGYYSYNGNSIYWNPFSYQGNQHIFSLVKTEEVRDASDVRLRRTDYTYDGAPLIDTPNVVNYDQSYGVNSSYSHTASTAYRGNVTNTTVYADAANLAGAIPYDSTYDITGNARTMTTNCCQQMSFNYTVNTQYSQPESHTKGSPTDPNQQMTESAVYDFNTGVPVHTVDFNGRQSTHYYDGIERPTQTILPSGGKQTTSYDDANLTVTEMSQLADNTIAAKSVTTLNGRGQTTSAASFAGGTSWNASAVKYDVMGRRSQVSMPYDASGQPSQWTTYQYDQLSRVVQVTAPDGSTSQTFYDEAQKPDSASAYPGNFVRSRDAWGRERWARTDDFGRLAEVVEPNPAGNGSVFDAGSLQTLYHHDPVDQLVGVTQGAQSRGFAYDSLGRLTLQKLAEAAATINGAGTYVGANGAGAAWSDAFTYDQRSNLVQRVDARGVKANFNYLVGSSPDPLNRLQGISYDSTGADATYPIHGAPPVTLSYLATGDKTRVQSVATANTATETNTYDIEGRISDYTLTLAGRPNNPLQMSYLYDTVNRLTEVRYPAAYGLAGNPRKTVNPTYDETSRLKQLNVDGQIQMNQIVYNPLSQVTQLTTGASTNNADVETYSYDAQTALLTNQKVIKQNSSQTLLDLSYEYNRGLSNGNQNGKTGQLTHIVNNLDRNKDRVYEFDTLGRLRTAKGGGATGVGGVTANWTQNYTFDRYGNRTSVTPTGITANSAVVPADGLPSLSYDQPLNRINTSGYLYDLAGNLTKGQDAAGNWQTYEYDQAGRMLRVRDASNNILETATFAADRNRIINETTSQRTYYAWGGASVIEEYTEPSAGNTPTYSKSYIYAGSRLLSTFTNNNGTETLQFQHPDRLGTKLVTNPTANSSFEQATLPFGTSLDAETTGTTNQRFTSYDRSAGTGLDYAVNRSYSSAQGRFTSVDPIGMSATSTGNPQSNNLYAYVENNPVDMVDPSGLDILKPEPQPGITIKTEYVTIKEEDPFLSDEWLRFAADSQELRSLPYSEMPQAVTELGTVGIVNVYDGGPDPVQTEKGTVKQKLVDFLPNKPKACMDILTALGLSDKEILNAFDKNTFKSGGPYAIHAHTNRGSWKTVSKTDRTIIPGSRKPPSTTTKNGVSDFVDSMGFLIHELSHIAADKGDVGIYNVLAAAQRQGSITGLETLPNKANGKPLTGQAQEDAASTALSHIFNNSCK